MSTRVVPLLACALALSTIASCKCNRSKPPASEAGLACVEGRSPVPASVHTLDELLAPLTCSAGTTLRPGEAPMTSACVDSKGLREGPTLVRASNGMPRARDQYRADKQQGESVEWEYPAESLVFHESVAVLRERGRLDPQAIERVPSRLREWKSGLLDGLATTWQKGRKSEEGRYLAGRKDGVWCQWDETGLIGQYEMNAGTGTETIMHARDKPALEVQRINGKREGAFTQWHLETGAKAIEGHFVADLEDGKWTQYDKQGAPLGSYMMRAGTGIRRAWAEDHSLSLEEGMVSGQKQGPSIRYWPSGKVRVETLNVKGERHGLERRYNEDGSLEREQRWEHGQLAP